MRKPAVLVCIGSEENADDGAGHLLYTLIREKLPEYVSVIFAGSVPENYVGKILEIKPKSVILFDAADFDGRPGEIRQLEVEDLERDSISTHRMPMRFLVKQLREGGGEVIIFGVQGLDFTVGSAMSDEVRESVEKFSKELVTLLD
jgi:hydrogenase maturation protease HycI